MPRSVQKVSTLVRTEFAVYTAADVPVLGLVDGDPNWTKLLSVNGANSAVVITITEVGNGRYAATFTPPTTGFWNLLIRHALYNLRGWTEGYDVTVDGDYSIDDILDKTDGVETGFTVRQAMRLMAAVLCGKVSGGPGTPVFRNMQDTANRVSSTADASGNRTVVTLTP